MKLQTARISMSILSSLLLLACPGPVSVDGGVSTLDAGAQMISCEGLELNSQNLKAALEKCPASGDVNIYGFKRAVCDARLETDCTVAERASLASVAACDVSVPVCASPNDRAATEAAITACAANLTVSRKCVTALGN
jgi:hypothetical protein